MNPTPSDISQVFGRNLRELVAKRPSISHVCRELDINRTQFNRYLSGEAHPRPHVLYEICAYFECDARILLTPLAEIKAEEPRIWPFAREVDAFETLSRDFDHTRMPDGLYQFLLPNMVEPGALVFDLIRLFTTDRGVKGVHWSVPKFYAEYIGLESGWSRRKLTGFAYQHAEGVSLLLANPYSRLIMMCFVTPGFRGIPTTYTGYAAMTISKGTTQTQVQPLIVKRLPPDCKSILNIRRNQPNMSLNDLTDAEKTYLSDWHAP